MKSILQALVIFSALTAPARAIVVINEDFEGEAGLPTGWAVIDNTIDPTNNIVPAFTITQGHSGGGVFGGQGGHLGDMIDGAPNNLGQPNGGWFQAPDNTKVSAVDPFTLDFDVKFEPEGTSDDGAIVFGNLGDAKRYYTVIVTEVADNNDAFWLVNNNRQGTGDAGTPINPTNSYVDNATPPANDTWYHGHLTWTPTTNILSFALTNPATAATLGSFSATLDSTQIASGEIVNPPPTGALQFGFGTINDQASFDNILLDGVPIIPGDTNNNGIGGEFPADFDPIRENFRKSPRTRVQGDLTSDGVVNFDDFREWKAVHGASGASLDGIDFGSMFAGVPEPSAVVLALFALASLSAWRGKR